MVRISPSSVPAHLPGLLLTVALFAAVSLLFGCSALHRDIEEWDDHSNEEIPEDTGPSNNEDTGPILPPEDTGTDPDDIFEPEDTDPSCVPGGTCGPCDLGTISCNDDDEAVCEGAVDLESNPEHCGTCENACDSANEEILVATCEQSQCVFECVDADETYCPDIDACINLQTDPEHCGTCENTCDTTNEEILVATCEQSQCVVTCIDEDETYCPDIDTCVNLQTDPEHCGTCENTCDVDNEELFVAACEESQCVVNCADENETYCPTVDACIDLQTDPEHCGTCENACDVDNEDILAVACEESQCVVDCVNENETYCPDFDACVNLQTDRNHCNGCGQTCPGNQSCCEGMCTGGGGC